MQIKLVLAAMTGLLATACVGCSSTCDTDPQCGVTECTEDVGDTAEYFFYCCVDGCKLHTVFQVVCRDDLDDVLTLDVALNAPPNACPGCSKKRGLERWSQVFARHAEAEEE